MTEKLKQLLHEQADAVEFAVPDLDQVAATGDRRRRRRRTGVVGGVAIVAAGAFLLGSGLTGDDRATDPATGVEDPAEVGYVIGSVLHTGGEEVELGHPVRAYVRTNRGIVFTDPKGRVYSWSGGSEVAAVGRTSARRPRLVSDDETSRAAWIDTSGDQPTLAVLDGAGLRTVRVAEQPLSAVYALDAGTAYLLDGRGAVAVDLASGKTTLLDPEASGDDEILDAENGLIAFNDPVAGGTVIGTRPGSGVRLPEAYGSSAAFSPDATWVSVDADEPQVFDVRTGERVDFDLDHRFATGIDWLDDSTLVMLAAKRPASDAAASLLTCRLPEGTCEVAVADLGTFEELLRQGFGLPLGEPLDQ